MREGLKNFLALSDEFTALQTFKNAEEALQEIPKMKPDIVIMDINLPGMNGIECIRQLRNKIFIQRQTQMFTVYENDEKVFEALKAGAIRIFIKEYRTVANDRIIETIV